MVAFPFSQRLILPVATTGGGLVAALAGIAMLAVPVETIEAAVMASGLPAILAAAEPPLGMTARIALASLAGVLCGGLAWLALHLLAGARSIAIPLSRRTQETPEAEPLPAGAPILRRADAHPDAPPRRPLMAEELGTPFLEVRAPRPVPVETPLPEIPAEQPLPADLSAPLAAFDPAAIPAAPAEPARPVAPLFRKPDPVQEPGERFEAFELPRVPVDTITPETSPMLAPRTEATIHALLERLERGVAQRARPTRQQAGLQDTLAELRTLAARG